MSTSTLFAGPAPSAERDDDADVGNESGGDAAVKGDLYAAVADYSEANHRDRDKDQALPRRGLSNEAKAVFDRAIAILSASIKLRPEDVGAFNCRGIAYEQRGDLERALADQAKAIRLMPDDPWSLVSRAGVWQAKRDYEKALTDLTEAIRIDPKLAVAYNNRAWLWATCPDGKYRDGKQAVESATRACEINGWKFASELDTLAAACAEAGDYEAAVKWQNQAIALTPVGDKSLERMRDRLKLYQDKHPYREDTRSP